MGKRSRMKELIVGLGLTMILFISTFSVQAQSEVSSLQSTKDYLEAEQLIEAIADELYKAHQIYPDFAYEIAYENNSLISVTVTGIDNHTIAKRIADQIVVLEDMGRAIANMDKNLLPELTEMSMSHILNEQQAEAYQPNVEVSKGLTNVLYTW